MNFFKLSHKNGNGDILKEANNKIKYKVFLSQYHNGAAEFFRNHPELEKTEIYLTTESKIEDENLDDAVSNDNSSETKIKDTNNPLLLISGAFYIATRYSVCGLIYLLNIDVSPNTTIGYLRNEYLEEIILADHNDPAAPYSDRYLMIIADCLAGLYSFNTVRDYAKAIALYKRVISMINDQNNNLVKIAHKRQACCEMLECTELNPPSNDLLNLINDNAKTDNFSRIVLACYYLTAPDIINSENKTKYYEAGKRLLINAIDENYRPGIALLEYLCKEEIITDFTKSEVKRFRKSNKPPISENHWYE